MKLIQTKIMPLEPNQKASRLEYKVFRKEVKCIEIANIQDLEEFIRQPKFPLSRKINDFIKFNPKDCLYLNNLIDSDIKMNKKKIDELIFSKIFKYKVRATMNYWLCRGWSVENAKTQISKFQSSISNKSLITKRKNKDYKSMYNTTIEYWTKRGFSKDDAIVKLKERQSTFSLEKCIKKHGIEKGTRIFTERQSKWIESLYEGKTKEEIIDFEKSKMVKFGQASKESLKVFLIVIEWLKNNHSDLEYSIGHGDKQEHCLYDEQNEMIFFYDFAIPSKKILIEFNGHVWHPTNDAWQPLKFTNKKTIQVREKENLKEQMASRTGHKLLKIWDTDSVDVNVKKCIDFIKINI